MVEGRRVLITGGAGFIGSHLAHRLGASNRVVVYDSLHRNSLQLWNTPLSCRVQVVRGDILDRTHLHTVLVDSRPDIVVHLAAIAGVPTVVSHPARTLQVNLNGTTNLLQAIQDSNLHLSRFVILSTSEVYGPVTYKGSEDDMTTLGPIGKPRWVYAMSKLAAEFYSYAYFREYGLPVSILRPFNVYGPGQVGEGAIHGFARSAIEGNPLVVHNDGSQIRSWCYVGDFVDALESVLAAPPADVDGQVFNIGNPQATTTVLGLAETVIRLCESRSAIEFRDIEYPEVEVRVPDISKAKKRLGFAPKVGLQEGIRRTLDWYKGYLGN